MQYVVLNSGWIFSCLMINNMSMTGRLDDLGRVEEPKEYHPHVDDVHEKNLKQIVDEGITPLSYAVGFDPRALAQYPIQQVRAMLKRLPPLPEGETRVITDHELGVEMRNYTQERSMVEQAMDGNEDRLIPYREADIERLVRQGQENNMTTDAIMDEIEQQYPQPSGTENLTTLDDLIEKPGVEIPLEDIPVEDISKMSAGELDVLTARLEAQGQLQRLRGPGQQPVAMTQDEVIDQINAAKARSDMIRARREAMVEVNKLRKGKADATLTDAEKQAKLKSIMEDLKKAEGEGTPESQGLLRDFEREMEAERYGAGREKLEEMMSEELSPEEMSMMETAEADAGAITGLEEGAAATAEGLSKYGGALNVLGLAAVGAIEYEKSRDIGKTLGEVAKAGAIGAGASLLGEGVSALAAGTALEGAVATAGAALSVLGPAAIVATVGFAVWFIVTEENKKAEQEKVRQKQQAEVDAFEAEKKKLASIDRAGGLDDYGAHGYFTEEEADTAYDNYYKQPQAIAKIGNKYVKMHDPDPEKSLYTKMQHLCDLANAQVDQMNNLGRLYQKYVGNGYVVRRKPDESTALSFIETGEGKGPEDNVEIYSDPNSFKDRDFTPIKKLNVAAIMRSPGNSIQEKYQNAIRKYFTADEDESLLIPGADAHYRAHLEDMSKNDPGYEKARNDAFALFQKDPEKFKKEFFDVGHITKPEDLDNNRPNFWELYYVKNQQRFQKEDMELVNIAHKQWVARGMKGNIKHVRETFHPGAIKVYDKPTRKDPHSRGRDFRPVDPEKPESKTPEETKIPDEPSSYKRSTEWSLAKRDYQFDPRLAEHYAEMSSYVYDIETTADLENSPYDLSSYSVKTVLQGRGGTFLQYNSTALAFFSAQDGRIMISTEGTDSPALERAGGYSKLVSDVIADLDARTTQVGEMMIHEGIFMYAQSIVEPIVSFIRTYYRKGMEVVFCGHSLGGGASCVLAYLVMQSEGISSKDITLYTYGAPRVFGQESADKFTKMFPYHYRVVYESDIVPYLFPRSETVGQYYGGYKHAGTEIDLRHTGEFEMFPGADREIIQATTFVGAVAELSTLMTGGMVGTMAGVVGVIGAELGMLPVGKSIGDHSRVNYIEALKLAMNFYKQTGHAVSDGVIGHHHQLFDGNGGRFDRIDKSRMYTQHGMTYLPTFHGGQVYMNHIPTEYILGLYFYEPDEIKGASDLLGLMVY